MKNAIRVNGKNAETAVWTLSNPKTGREVTLVGMVHIGDKSYYNQIGGRLSALAAGGSEVHYELLRQLGDAEVAALSETERADLMKIRSLTKKSSTIMIADKLGLSLQKTELSYPQGSINVDMSDFELFQRLGWLNSEKMFNTESFADFDADRMRMLLKFALENYSLLALAGSVIPAVKRNQAVILKERNRVAARAAIKRLRSGGDVTLVWGAAHLPGLLKIFRYGGYRLVREDWFKVCDL